MAARHLILLSLMLYAGMSYIDTETLVAPLTLVVVSVAAFAWAVRSGQFDDTVTPPIRILLYDRSLLPAPSDESRHDASRS